MAAGASVGSGGESTTANPTDFGLVDDTVTFHFLRHTHGSQLVAAGWDIAAVAARLGDSIATVQQTYVHEFDAQRREEQQCATLAAIAAQPPMAAPGGTERALRAVTGGTETPS